MLTRVNKPGFVTHMPFLSQDASGAAVLFFCRAVDPEADGTYIWKAYYLDADGEPRRLATGIADDLAECSPTAWHDETGWHVSFIAGGKPDSPRFDLYRMDGPALDLLSPPVALKQTRTGFVYRDRLAWGDMQDLVHVQGGSNAQDIELPGANIYRVAYRADAPDSLLITGRWRNGDEVFTLEYDLTDGRQNFIECDGCGAYKCTILGDEIIYAECCGNHFEDRLLRRSQNSTRRSTKIAVSRQPVAEQIEQVERRTPDKKRGPCTHLGGELRRVLCKSCRSTVRIKVMNCAVHGECTVRKPVPGVSAVCRSCTDWTPHDGA